MAKTKTDHGPGQRPMKLAEALLVRADQKKKLASLRERLVLNGRVQEGDQPHEDPEELLREAASVLQQQEDLLLRIMDLVESSGSGFAFPSQILYMSKDEGLDESRGAEAAEAVRRWRDEGELPFPDHSPARVSQLNCTLEYPPGGSVLSGNKDHP